MWFPPVYGPQVPLALAPLGWFSYNVSLGLWVVLSATLYFVLCRVVIVRADRVSRASRSRPAGCRHVPGVLAARPARTALPSSPWPRSCPRGCCSEDGREVAAGAVLGLLVLQTAAPGAGPRWSCCWRARGRCSGQRSSQVRPKYSVTVFWVGFDGIRRYVLLMLHTALRCHP